MRQRYETWVEGLNGDWLISRQRFFGVPFPVWYPLDADGEVDYDDAARCPTEDQLPIDPSSDVPAGLHRRPARRARRLHRRPRRDGHVGDLVADAADRDRLGRRPRPVRPHVPDGPAPAGPRDHPHLAVRHGGARALRARHAAVDATPRSTAGSSTPTARRCRSRKGNVVTPMPLLEQYGADAVRYWARERPARAPTPRSTRAR